MKKKVLASILLLALFVSAGLFAQTTATHDVSLTINAVALLALNDASAITLQINAASAGAAVTGETLTDARYLRYTTLVTGTEVKKITVGASASAPTGTSFKITATTSLGSGLTATIGETAVDLITGIGSGNTGTAAADGAALTYEFAITDASLLDAGNSSTLTITYTLTDG